MIDALARVIADLTGRTPERVIAALSRDVDDPTKWRLFREPNRSNLDPEEYRLRWQRTQTRKSRLVVRLCEELVATATGTVRSDELLGTSLSYFQQLASAIMLCQHGHLQEGAELARRAFQRATSAGESAFAVLAADMIVALQLGPDDERANARFTKEIRRWRDIDHSRRLAAELLIRCFEKRRHISDQSKEIEIEQSLEQLLEIATVSKDPTIDLCISALNVQLLLVRRKNFEAMTLVNTVAVNLQKLPSLSQWLGQWLLVARVRANLAVGDYATVLQLSAALNTANLRRTYLRCDVARLRSIASMRIDEWERARLSIIEGVTIAAENGDPLDQQCQMVLVAYYNLGATLGYHSVPISVGTKRVSSLMNSIDQVLKDRMGLAPIALIYEVTAYLLEGKIELAERKMSNLQVYSTRNLRYHGASAMKAFISVLRMIVFHKGTFTSDDRRVRLFLSKITDEHESATEQMISPLPLRKLAQSLIDVTNGRHRQTSV